MNVYPFMKAASAAAAAIGPLWPPVTNHPGPAHRLGQRACAYAYTGNVHDGDAQSTCCSQCGERVIQRDWYRLDDYRLHDCQGRALAPRRCGPSEHKGSSGHGG